MSKSHDARNSTGSSTSKFTPSHGDSSRFARKQEFLRRLENLSPKQREAAFKKKNPSLYQKYRTGTRLLMCSDASGHGGIAVCAYLTGSKEFTFYVKRGKRAKNHDMVKLELEGLRVAWRAMSNYSFDRCAMFCDNAAAVDTAGAANNRPDVTISWTKGHTKFSSVQSKLNRLADSAATLECRPMKLKAMKNLLYEKVKKEFPWAEFENVKIVRVA